MSSTATQPIEEQTLLKYRQKQYYPVTIGQVLNDRYKIITKLGFGGFSTVWLARDLKCDKYASVKVCVQGSATMNEVLDGASGKHYCFVFKAHGGSVRFLQELYGTKGLPKLLVKSLVHRVLFALNFLHVDGQVVHTDVSPMNVLCQTEDPMNFLSHTADPETFLSWTDVDSVFRELEEDELRSPSVPTITDDGPIYPTRIMQPVWSGVPVLTDFGHMRHVKPTNTDWCMPDLYRAPEVLLGLPWGFAVDIWSTCVMMLELLEGKNLFDPIDRVGDGKYVLPVALAQYIGYLGLPPLDMVKQSPLFETYFDAEGRWMSDPAIPTVSFEDFITVIPPGEEKDILLKFVRSILTWDQEARLTANEAIEHEWLMRPVRDEDFSDMVKDQSPHA